MNSFIVLTISVLAYIPESSEFSGTSGESMENALRACCKGIKIGKILIHGEGKTGRQVCGANKMSSYNSNFFVFAFLIAAKIAAVNI